MKVVCLIPIKLNNVRLPNKNIITLKGNPLCSYIFNTLSNIEVIDETYCFCSNKKIINYLPEKINFLERNTNLDGDEVVMNDVIESFINKIDSDIYVLVHVTSPFLKKNSINICINKVLNEKYDSAFSGIYVNEFLWYNNKPLNYNLSNIPRTQDLKNVIKETSGIYVFKKEIFKNHKQRIGFNPYILIVDSKEACDIDTINDLKLAEILY